MKKALFIPMLLFSLMGCQEKIETAFEYGLQTKILIDRNVSVNSVPLTRAGDGNIYYAIEIDSISVVNGETVYHRFAEGVFTDPQNMTVTLDKNRKYYFRCAVLEDGKDKIYVSNNSISAPFTDSGNKSVYVSNEFVYTPGCLMDLDNDCSYVVVNDGEEKVNAEVHRYYGEYVDTTPRKTNSTVTIPVKRYNFGLLFNITPPDEGQIHVYQNFGSPKYDYVVSANDERVYDERIYAMDLVSESQMIYLKVEWIRSNGETIDYSPAPFKAYNRTKTIVDIDLVSYVTTNSVNVSMDSGMEENTIQIH